MAHEPVSRQPVIIRPYRPADLDALYQVCLQTGLGGGDATAFYRDHKLLGHVHAAPYALFEPSLAFVAEDAAGVGGYVLGALDSHDFEARLERDWWPWLRARYPEPPAGVPYPEPPAGVPADQWAPEQAEAHLIHHPWVTPAELASRYPSHLHIDLVPRLQSRGHGRRLISTLTGALRRRGSRGVGSRRGRVTGGSPRQPSRPPISLSPESRAASALRMSRGIMLGKRQVAAPLISQRAAHRAVGQAHRRFQPGEGVGVKLSRLRLGGKPQRPSQRQFGYEALVLGFALIAPAASRPGQHRAMRRQRGGQVAPCGHASTVWQRLLRLAPRARRRQH